jgi:large subunit ribosomal protein L4
MTNIKNINFASLEIANEETDIFVSKETVEELDSDNFASLSYVLGWQFAKRRSGSADSKEMSEISGTTAKPHKQKGTGSARQGSKRSVQFRGGRTCFGPKARSFEYAIPKKVVKKALNLAVASKIKDEKLISFSEYDVNLKTSKIDKFLKSNNITKALFLYSLKDGEVDNFSRPIRNIKNVKSLNVAGLNVYDVINCEFLLVDKVSLQTIKGVLL